MPHEIIPENCFLHTLKYLGFKGQKLWTSDDGDYFTWDSRHGEIEWFTSRGRHLGVRDAITGDLIKPAVKGRKINVK